MKKLFLFLATMFLFYSCDYYGNYNYEISNQTNKNILIKYEESVDTRMIEKKVEPGKAVLIADSFVSRIGKYENPPDIFKDTLADFGNLEIFIDNQKINKNFKLGKYWKFAESRSRESTYTLIVNDTLISNN